MCYCCYNLAKSVTVSKNELVQFGRFDSHSQLGLRASRSHPGLRPGDSTLIVLDLTVGGLGDHYAIAGDDPDFADIQTVGDLLIWLNAEYAGAGSWSLNADGNGFDLRTAPNASIVLEGTLAIGIAGTGELVSSHSTDEAVLPFIGHAEADGTSITVTAAEVGKDTFHIQDVKLDYEGIHQIATADYDHDSDEYYDGGIVAIEIDVTPGGLGNYIRIEANMVAGDRMASLQNLVDEINSNIVATSSAAQVKLPGSDFLGLSTTNQGDSFDTGLYISAWSVTVGTGDDEKTYAGRGEAVSVEGDLQWNVIEGQSEFADLEAFLTYISGLDGVGTATLDGAGNIVITSDAQGSNAYISASYDVALFVDEPESPHLSGTRSDYGASGELNGTVGHAVLNEDGTITIVSENAVHEAFVIMEAELSTAPVTA